MLLSNRWLQAVLLCILIPCTGYAYNDGISGYTQSGCGGGSCHGGSANANTSVFFRNTSGTITMTPGESKTFTAVVGHATLTRAGINIGVKNSSNQNVGTLTAGTGLKTQGGEVTHTAPRAMSNNEAEFTFTWVAPSTPGTYTIRAAGNAVNNDGGRNGDTWNLMTDITVQVQNNQPTIAITSLNTAATFCRNAQVTINWTGAQLSGNTVVEMTPGLGQPWTQIGSVAAATTTFSWTVPVAQAFGKSYRFRVTNSTAIDTNDAGISILPVPGFTTQPKPFDTVCAGNAVTLTVVPDAPDTLFTYQWFRGTTPIANANSRTYTINNAQEISAGTYRVELTGCSTVSSANSLLSVIPATVITTQPQSATVCAGIPVKLSVAATGAGLTYQWRRNGVNLANQTNNELNIAAVAAADTGNYDCVVTGRCLPALTSNTATVSIIPNPVTIVNFRSDTSICEGSSLRLEANGQGGQIVNYEWRRNNTVLPITDPVFAIASLSPADSGVYSVAARNNCGTLAEAKTIKLNVLAAPLFLRQPADTIAQLGTQARLRVIASGSNLRYQWLKNGVPRTADTLNILTIASAQYADSGTYECRISNRCGNVTSNKAKLSISSPPSGPFLSLALTAIDLGCVEKGTQKDTALNAVVRNTGDAALNVTAAEITGSDATSFSITAGNAPFTLEPGATRSITLRYTAGDNPVASAKLGFLSNSSGTPGTIALNAQSCFENISTAAFSLGTITLNQGATYDTTLRICNTGNRPLSVTEAAITGNTAFALIDAPALPLTVNGGECKEFKLRFTAGAAGDYAAQLSIKTASRTYAIPLSAKVNSTSGISQNIVPGLELMPTPAISQVKLNMPNDFTLRSIRIIDMLGRIQWEQRYNAVTQALLLDISGLAPGTYTVLAENSLQNIYALPMLISR